MNYRHAFHAGNFADVLKHLILTLVIEHLKQKPAPFRVIDTHAGAGRYHLDGDEASRAGEWRQGIGRLLADPIPPGPADVLAPYLQAVCAENGGGPSKLTVYPGSPLLARRLMRRGDQLVASELNPAEHAALAQVFRGDPQSKVLGIDGWTALRSLLPPKERRGVVLVDPPFEEPGELRRLNDGLREALRRFETGVFLLWYPIKDPKPAKAFLARLAEIAPSRLAAAELLIRKPVNPDLLNGCGVAIVNPPYLIDEKLEVVLPFLASRLAAGSGAEGRYVRPGASSSRSSM